MDLKEEYFTEAMRCKGIEPKVIEDIIREFRGCRVYFKYLSKKNTEIRTLFA